MIFVTVGTHEQPFDRLVKAVDRLKQTGRIEEDVLIQTGYSTYVPAACEARQWIPYQEMNTLVKEARIVITHGGPSSFMMPLMDGKIPIVVPRRKKYQEHVNDHQVDFCRAVAKQYNNILLAETMRDLAKDILSYEEQIRALPVKMQSHQAEFAEKLEAVVTELFY